MKYKCQVCGYVYDDEKEKIPFEQLPDTWKCPLCGAPKSAFVQEGDTAEAKAAEAIERPLPTSSSETVTGDIKLSAGQLAALCSNLARGCEKQYMTEEAELFRKLADHMATITPPVEDASVEMVASALTQDVADYPGVRDVIDNNKDRGAARALTWGEKVSRMLASLMERYMSEGEDMLKEQNVYLCTACGFVYLGSEAPELCPVCKVPSWKFEKIEGRA